MRLIAERGCVDGTENCVGHPEQWFFFARNVREVKIRIHSPTPEPNDVFNVEEVLRFRTRFDDEHADVARR